MDIIVKYARTRLVASSLSTADPSYNMHHGIDIVPSYFSHRTASEVWCLLLNTKARNRYDWLKDCASCL
jgi:hypothetical protein